MVLVTEIPADLTTVGDEGTTVESVTTTKLDINDNRLEKGKRGNAIREGFK